MISETELNLLILQFVHFDLDAKILLSIGYKYNEIIPLINRLVMGNYIYLNDSKYCLTDTGIKELNRIKAQLKVGGSSYFMSPLYQFKTEKLKKDFIYVPRIKKRVGRG